MKQDPIISEIREVREAHAAKFNYDLDAIFADIQQSEKKLKSEGWKFASPLNPKRKRIKNA
ncbi:MAG: hypothetical protein ACR2H1_13405 [Limisphaerales bacterium]